MIKRVLASRKGASSILVILLLVVLVVFGIAALTTALSGLRLGQKVADWNEQYYGAEAQAWERCAEIDRTVDTALSTETADAVAVEKALSRLDFDTTCEQADDGLHISYEAWADSGKVGIRAMLLVNLSDGSLTVIQWREVQQEDAA